MNITLGVLNIFPANTRERSRISSPKIGFIFYQTSDMFFYLVKVIYKEKKRKTKIHYCLILYKVINSANALVSFLRSKFNDCIKNSRDLYINVTN